MSKKIVKNLGGRPTKYSPVVVEKLASIFKLGGSVEEACSYANIDKGTYYNWIDAIKGFSTEMESAQHYSDIAAKNVVVGSILKHKNIESSKWWLEKRVFKNNTTNNFNIQVIPILGNKFDLYVPNNDGDNQDSEPKEEN